MAWFIFCIKYSTKFEFAIVARIPCLLIRHQFSLSSSANLAIYAHLLYSKMSRKIRSKCVFSGTCNNNIDILRYTQCFKTRNISKQMGELKYLPWQLLFDFVLAEFFHNLHIVTEKHGMNRASHTENISLIRPKPTFQHFRASEAIRLNHLRMRQYKTWRIHKIEGLKWKFQIELSSELTFLNCVFGLKNFISIAHPKSINLNVGTSELGFGLKVRGQLLLVAYFHTRMYIDSLMLTFSSTKSCRVWCHHGWSCKCANDEQCSKFDW